MTQYLIGNMNSLWHGWMTEQCRELIAYDLQINYQFEAVWLYLHIFPVDTYPNKNHSESANLRHA